MIKFSVIDYARNHGLYAFLRDKQKKERSRHMYSSAYVWAKVLSHMEERLGAVTVSAWFDDNLEISIISDGSTASKAQAKQIVKAFFSSHTPQSFDITHAAEKANMKYALGSLTAGGENFMVTIFVSSKGDSYKIQQLKIERM